MTFWVGNFGAGGPKFPTGPIPGALPLQQALGGNLTFLSARPGMLASQTRRDLFDAGVFDAALLVGDLGTTLSATFRKDAHSAMGEKKVQSFCTYAALHPEAFFVFIGDTGEGDVELAESFAKHENFIALLHDVVEPSGVLPKTQIPERRAMQDKGIIVFDTYIAAALCLHRKGILDAVGFRAAAQGCHDEFISIGPNKFSNETVYLERRTELLNDLHKADEALREAGLQPVARKVAEDDVPFWRM